VNKLNKLAPRNQREWQSLKQKHREALTDLIRSGAVKNIINADDIDGPGGAILRSEKVGEAESAEAMSWNDVASADSRMSEPWWPATTAPGLEQWSYIREFRAQAANAEHVYIYNSNLDAEQQRALGIRPGIARHMGNGEPMGVDPNGAVWATRR
jgi:hypothetical protein